MIDLHLKQTNTQYGNLALILILGDLEKVLTEILDYLRSIFLQRCQNLLFSYEIGLSNMVKNIFGAIHEIDNSNLVVKDILQRISNFLISNQQLTISNSGLFLRLTTLGLKVSKNILSKLSYNQNKYNSNEIQ